ncbi:MAG TPA: hypothetical protein VFQ45_10740 [Longimicrobium sp.]|nr:hypothetical protein [Longimicrobium sp.]
MKKLALNPEELQVDSFDTQGNPETRGTVHGNSWWETCDPWYTCRTYEGTCHNWGCNTGLTSMCGTENATDCPGWGECPRWTENANTCAYNSCTDREACTICNAVC